uniref:Putative polyglutamine tract-binding protein pqbp-1 n=1 Tax=Culex tarsalis TaxID=7177 RepID=A0A1Q3F325_CULTA
MLPEALLKRLAQRGIIQPGAVAPPAAPAPDQDRPQQRPSPPPSRQQQHSDSSSESDSQDGDEEDIDGEEAVRDADNNEEIIAEDYDEYDQVNPDNFEYPVAKKPKATPAMDWSEKMKQKMVKRYGFQSVDGCQNKNNIYHHCSMYCVQRYGEVEFEIEKEYEKRVKRLLERYPLPRHWRKEYDIGCKAFYFYNKETRIVSWLPPTHPDAKMTKSAKVLRKELMEKTKSQEQANEATPKAVIVESYPPIPKPPTAMVAGGVGSVGPVGESLKPPVVNPPKRPHMKPPARDDDKRPRLPERDRERGNRDRNRDRRDQGRRDDRRERGPRGRGKEGGALDPMDPAAYSDIPRGTWSSGLEVASAESKKADKLEKKEEKRKPAGPSKEDDSGDEHEVLKVSAINEFTQEDDKDD